MNTRLSSLFIDSTSDNIARIAVGAFDFDGNILAPDTPYHMIVIATGEEISIPAHQIDQHPELISGPSAMYRWKDDVEASLTHFRDFGSNSTHRGPDQLIQDIQEAIEHKHFSPSFKAFKEIFLIPARLFALITARGHSADNLARAIMTISEATLDEHEKGEQYKNIQILYKALNPGASIPNREQALQFYFQNIVSYYPVNNIHVMKFLGMNDIKSSPEKKTFCMNHYIASMKSQVLARLGFQDTPLAIGFSDDSVGNMIAMLEYFLKKKTESPSKNTINLYFTGTPGTLQIPDNDKIRVTEVDGMTVLQL